MVVFSPFRLFNIEEVYEGKSIFVVIVFGGSIFWLWREII